VATTFVKALYGVAVNLKFLGTRGEIDARTRRHRMHTSLLVAYRGANVMIDAGLDWLGKLERVSPSAIVLTHAHPRSCVGIETGRAVSGVCTGENVAGTGSNKKSFCLHCKISGFREAR
jgi:ribonuclease BN (tRNA processing enzyme)